VEFRNITVSSIGEDEKGLEWRGSLEDFPAENKNKNSESTSRYQERGGGEPNKLYLAKRRERLTIAVVCLVWQHVN
jgi:hypothetical protein